MGQWSINDIITIISIVLQGVLIPLIVSMLERHKRLKHDMEIEKKGTQAILRNELLQLSYKYLEIGKLDYSEKLNYENMYNAYHNLGKNGVMTELYNKVMALPICHKD